MLNTNQLIFIDRKFLDASQNKTSIKDGGFYCNLCRDENNNRNRTKRHLNTKSLYFHILKHEDSPYHTLTIEESIEILRAISIGIEVGIIK